jgi:hypothetical protein
MALTRFAAENPAPRARCVWGQCLLAVTWLAIAQYPDGRAHCSVRHEHEGAYASSGVRLPQSRLVIGWLQGAWRAEDDRQRLRAP